MATLTPTKSFSMLNTDKIAAQDYEQMAKDVIKLSKAKTENELKEAIGNGMYDLGLQTSSKDDNLFIQHTSIGKSMNAMKAFTFLADSKPLTTKDAKKEGERFFKKFKDNLKKEICNNKTIQDFINNKGDLSLKDVLTKIIPLILIALGIASLNPILLGIIIGALALLLKVGFKTYCEV